MWSLITKVFVFQKTKKYLAIVHKFQNQAGKARGEIAIAVVVHTINNKVVRVNDDEIGNLTAEGHITLSHWKF